MTGVAVPRPRSRPAPDASVQRPTAIDLFIEAGGDTPDFDPDRYVGLLRRHGYANEPKPLSEILQTVVGRHTQESPSVDDYEALARILADELGKHGYRIHDITRCVRPKDDPLTFGRPMTPEEEARLVIPTARPRRRRQ